MSKSGHVRYFPFRGQHGRVFRFCQADKSGRNRQWSTLLQKIRYAFDISENLHNELPLDATVQRPNGSIVSVKQFSQSENPNSVGCFSYSSNSGDLLRVTKHGWMLNSEQVFIKLKKSIFCNYVILRNRGAIKLQSKELGHMLNPMSQFDCVYHLPYWRYYALKFQFRKIVFIKYPPVTVPQFFDFWLISIANLMI